jgi:hypothetical protein
VGNARLPENVLSGKFRGRRFVRRPQLRWETKSGGLLIAVEYRSMEGTRLSGGELLKGPEFEAGRGAIEEEKKEKMLQQCVTCLLL